MDQEIYKKLERLAYERTNPFCYSCYEEAPTGACVKCGSDDLMRLLPGVGCEYGTDWVIEEILGEELEAVDLDEAFEEYIRQCYPEETQVGWLTLDTVSVLKEMDPVSWSCSKSDWESQEESEGLIITLDNGSTYYRASDVEALVRSDI